jgi:hypothetical protein
MADHATVANTLRLGTGFTPDDRAHLESWLETLDARLRRYSPDRVELEISVKQRGTRPQVTLICHVAGLGGEPARKFVATSKAAKAPGGSLQDAIRDARDDLRRQIDRIVTRKETSRRRSGDR